jgi:ABC-2 type transport system ATP-binding protein/lipopolysaccharide transport system ATP-binding protein
MTRSVIEVEGVSKMYRLGQHNGSGADLRETVTRAVRRLRRAEPAVPQEIWSLRDITFDVTEGTAVGIIGANGAGKSTLLKVINNITTPTEGTSRTRGRIGSLLEVGTGFHPELTGLENTYLNGAILGMTRREVTRRLDEIVAFAGMERFMDTPVKRYSSGMYLRLGFAIAAHIEADVLLVDEVLAVGDAEFQRRCLGKMNEVEHSGRTVVFVSHNLDALSRLCARSVWLERGRIRAIGPTVELVNQYMRAGSSAGRRLTFDADGSLSAQVTGLMVLDDRGEEVTTIGMRDAAWICVEVVVHESLPGLDVGCVISTRTGIAVTSHLLSESGCREMTEPGRYRVACLIPPVLMPGEFVVSLWTGTQYETVQEFDDVLGFTVQGDDEGRKRRLVRLSSEWRSQRIDDHVTGGR